MTKRKVAQLDLIDLLLADYEKPEDLIGENGILKQLTKAVVERALQVELAVHLAHNEHEAVVNDSGNTRNGSSAKTLKGDFGALPIELPPRSRWQPGTATDRQASDPLDGVRRQDTVVPRARCDDAENPKSP